MTKYARFVWKNNESDHTVHLVDVLDMNVAAYQPRPLLGCMTDEELLSKLFSANKDQWVTDDEWFAQVPDGVKNGATFIGTWPADQFDPSKYENPEP